MTIQERNKLDLRLSTSLLELSILHVELKKHGRMDSAALIEGAAQMVERAKALLERRNHTEFPRVDRVEENPMGAAME